MAEMTWAQAVVLYQEGVRASEIARRLGMHHSTVTTRLKREGVHQSGRPRGSVPKAERNPTLMARPETYPPIPSDPDSCAKVLAGEEHEAHWWGWRNRGPIRCQGHRKQHEPQVA